MKTENAINFLLFSYFELTLDSDEDEIINAAIRRAYRDASSRVLSITEETKYTENKNETLKDAATKYLYERIKNLDNSTVSTKGSYSNWHEDICENLVNSIYKNAMKNNKNGTQEHAFRYGHAQKWVNMTMKYLYVIKSIFQQYGVEEPDILKKLTQELEEQLHVPIDGYILKAASMNNDSGTGLSLELPQKKEGNGDIIFGSYNGAKSWSNWNKNDYIEFLKKLIEKLNECNFSNPLDWETEAWIEIGKTKK